MFFFDCGASFLARGSTLCFNISVGHTTANGMYIVSFIIFRALPYFMYVLANVVPLLDFFFDRGKTPLAYIPQYSLFAFLAAFFAFFFDPVSDSGDSVLVLVAGASHVYYLLVIAAVVMCDAHAIGDVADGKGVRVFLRPRPGNWVRTTGIFVVAAGVSTGRTLAIVHEVDSAGMGYGTAGILALVSIALSYLAFLVQFIKGTVFLFERITAVRRRVYAQAEALEARMLSEGGGQGEKEREKDEKEKDNEDVFVSMRAFVHGVHEEHMRAPLDWALLDACVCGGVGAIAFSIVYVFVLSVTGVRGMVVVPWLPLVVDAVVTIFLSWAVTFGVGTLLARYQALAALVLDIYKADCSEKGDDVHAGKTAVLAAVLEMTKNTGVVASVGVSVADSFIAKAYGNVSYVVIFVAVLSNLYPR